MPPGLTRARRKYERTLQSGLVAFRSELPRIERQKEGLDELLVPHGDYLGPHSRILYHRSKDSGRTSRSEAELIIEMPKNAS